MINNRSKRNKDIDEINKLIMYTIDYLEWEIVKFYNVNLDYNVLIKSKGMGYYFKIMLDGSRKLYKKIPLEDNYEFENVYLVGELYKVIEDKINLSKINNRSKE